MPPTHICDVLRDLVPFVQLRKREKQPWKSVTSSIKSCNASHKHAHTYVCMYIIYIYRFIDSYIQRGNNNEEGSSFGYFDVGLYILLYIL